MARRPDAPRRCARRFSMVRRRAWCACIAGMLALWLGAAPSLAAPPGTSARGARDEAIRSIPMNKLAADDRERIVATISGTSLYRRLPVQVTPCDPDLYLFLIRHPEVVVNIWEVMNVSNVALTRTSETTFRASDGAGTLCNVKYCYSDHDTQIIYAEGSYDGPLFNRPVRASCVLILRSGYMRETDGRYYVTSRMDTFVQIEHAGVELLAKTLQPLVHRSADYNFTETAAFVGSVSKAAESNPAGVNRLANKLKNLDPATRERFAQLAAEVGRKARGQGTAQASAVGALPQPSPRGKFIERR